MARRTKLEAAQTRQRLLDAAERLFQQHGVAHTSLQDIAQAAGLTRGAVYWHFADKAALFNAMMERVTLPLEQAAQQRTASAPSEPLRRLRDNLLDALRRIAADAQMQRVFDIATQKVEYVEATRAVRERHLEARRAGVAQMQAELRDAVRRGQLVPRLPLPAAAVGLHALLDGLIRNWVLDPQTFDLVRVGRHTIDAYLAGIGAPAPPAGRTRA